MAFIRIAIFTRNERNEAISLIRQAIGACGGWIVDHSLFSNLRANINFELPADQIEGFRARLLKAGFKPEIEADGTDKGPAQKSGDMRGQIALSFIHDEPDLHREVPPFG